MRRGKEHVFQTASTSIGVPLDSIGGGGLGGTGGGASREG